MADVTPYLAGIPPFWLDAGFYFALALGLCLGSFSTALSYRLPRGISMIAKERSACNSCQAPLGFIDLVPLLSWLALRGRCRRCGAPIGWRYPLIELSTLGLCLLFFFAFAGAAGAGAGSMTALYFLAATLVAMIDIDFQFKIIPDELNLAVLAIGAGLAAWLSFANPYAAADIWFHAVLGMLIFGLGSFFLRFAGEKALGREPLGLGDVKFFAAAGFWLGTDAMTAALYIGLSGALGVVLALAWQKWRGEREFPFGPALLLAFVAVLLAMKPGLLAYM